MPANFNTTVRIRLREDTPQMWHHEYEDIWNDTTTINAPVHAKQPLNAIAPISEDEFLSILFNQRSEVQT